MIQQAPGGDSRFDFWVAVLTAAATVTAFAAAIATLPKSGPFCASNCVGYPYTDIALYIPRDFLWMYPALLPAPLFVILLNVLHERTSTDRKRFSRLAITFAAMAAAILTVDYLIQLRVIQPAVIKGELDGLAPLTQYNPHGVFIALEEAGYLLMAVAFLFGGLAISPEPQPLRVLRYIFIAGFAAAAVLFVTLSIAYGTDLDYRFEVSVIAVDWLVLIAAGIVLARSVGP